MYDSHKLYRFQLSIFILSPRVNGLQSYQPKLATASMVLIGAFGFFRLGEVLNQQECRVRAFSVGSRNAPGSKFLASRPLAHDLHARHPPGGHFTPPSLHRVQPAANKKSSSAPLLSNSWSGSPMNRHLLSGSHSSVEPMDDLMEMDFSHNASNKSVRKSLAKSRTKTAPPTTQCDPVVQADRDRLGPMGTSRRFFFSTH